MRPDPLRIAVCALAIGIVATLPWLDAGADAGEETGAAPAEAVIVVDDFADDVRGLAPELVERRTRIRDELTRGDLPPWAGEFFRGDGLGENTTFVLAPHAGVAATWHGCLGLYGADHGPIQVADDGSLALGFAQSKSADDAFGRFPAKVQSLRWGERRYLLESDRMVDFVNALHHGWEPRDERHGQFLLARGDEARAVSGLPSLPSPWREAIRTTPVEAGTVAVERVPRSSRRPQSPRPTVVDESDPLDSFCEQDYTVTIDRGRDDGLVPGLELRATAPVAAWETLRLQRVDARSAVGEVSVLGDDCESADDAPRTDWSWTTGAYAPDA